MLRAGLVLIIAPENKAYILKCCFLSFLFLYHEPEFFVKRDTGSVQDLGLVDSLLSLVQRVW